MTELNIAPPAVESTVVAPTATVDSNVVVAPAASAEIVATPIAPIAGEAEKPATEAIPATPEVKLASSILTPPAAAAEEPSKPEGEAAANENVAAQPQAPIATPEIPVYEPFVLPEGVEVDEKELGEFKNLIGEYKAPQEFGQKLLDRHIAELNRFQQTQLQAWETEKESWAEDFRKDQEIGGNRAQTTIDSAHKFIRTHGGTPEQQQELYDILARTGLNNHKALIRIFAKAAAAPVLNEGTPRPAPQNPVGMDKAARWYGKTG